jgi:hypothetical protein
MAAASEARAAFDQLDWSKGGDDEVLFVGACVDAEQLARTFLQRVRKAKAKLQQAKELRKALAVLRSFLEELIDEQKEPSDPLRVRELEPPEHIEAMGYGLALFERRRDRPRSPCPALTRSVSPMVDP